MRPTAGNREPVGGPDSNVSPASVSTPEDKPKAKPQSVLDALADAETLRQIAAGLRTYRYDKWARFESLTRSNLTYPSIVAHAAFGLIPGLRG